ncbi:CRISPR system precrRNA processing endoribonuclease RAMP protein Cas6 [Carboxydocella sp. JDF658]|uniref:CRISPR system precrRNA processing endoribonuclease RAMP protein Cas6 n=1 Tax=Carboxydocella sp. JDF658 TaxID=1926600 RepID=UPI0009AE699C|nr:CRISPR system precrRNA processing endoribonuclease RAMP protein Cas6 [Carboxydocella sp. JDF658]GAW32211.1 hypothetical protein JDF658_19760 [Carboxydocella sp. JDF658]
MLQKAIFHLICLEEGYLQGNGGLQLHGWLFHQLARVDAKAATELHELEHKPFALSPLIGSARREGGKMWTRSQQKYSFALSALNEPMVELLHKLLALPPAPIQLGTASFWLEKTKLIYPSGFGYLDLMRTAKYQRAVILHFNSHTSFRQVEKQFLFPTPKEVFGSLTEKWNAFTNGKFPELDFDQILQVARYELKTGMVDFGSYKIIGFTGHCQYQLAKGQEEIMGVHLDTLARYAALAGVGYKTTMGLGDTRATRLE